MTMMMMAVGMVFADMQIAKHSPVSFCVLLQSIDLFYYAIQVESEFVIIWQKSSGGHGDLLAGSLDGPSNNAISDDNHDMKGQDKAPLIAAFTCHLFKTTICSLAFFRLLHPLTIVGE